MYSQQNPDFMRHLLLYILLLTGITELSSQESLAQIFRFINFSPSARTTALGGYAIALWDNDPSLGLMNPVSLTKTTEHQISFQSARRFGNTKSGDAVYANYFESFATTLFAGVHYVDYGSFDGMDAKGNASESFTAKEKAFVIGASKPLHPQYSIGANIKYISSTLDHFQSSALLGDLALMYHSPDKSLTATLLAKNFGYQISAYNENKEPLPTELLAGISKRLKHLPFRYHLTYRYLNRWNLLYYNPEEESQSLFNGQTKEKSKALIYLDNLSRHLILGGELLLGKKENFRLRIGYNQGRRKDLAPREYFNLSAFSFGFGFKLYHIRVDYGYSRYHQAGIIHHFGLSTALSEFFGKKNTEIHTGGIGDLPIKD